MSYPTLGNVDSRGSFHYPTGRNDLQELGKGAPDDMKLKELAEATDASAASIKYWIRSGLLPAGRLKNTTTAVYGDEHVERIRLIQVLRDKFDVSIAGVRRVVDLIDDPAVGLLDVMQECQVVASGLDAGDDDESGARSGGRLDPGSEGADSEAADPTARIDVVCSALGWPVTDSVARTVLARVLREAADMGIDYGHEELLAYARMLDPIARRDVTDPRMQGSRDAVATRVLRGVHVQRSMLTAMNDLAHTSASIARMSGA